MEKSSLMRKNDRIFDPIEEKGRGVLDQAALIP
jgi:hypothetical protein